MSYSFGNQKALAEGVLKTLEKSGKRCLVNNETLNGLEKLSFLGLCTTLFVGIAT